MKATRKHFSVKPISRGNHKGSFAVSLKNGSKVLVPPVRKHSKAAAERWCKAVNPAIDIRHV